MARPRQGELMHRPPLPVGGLAMIPLGAALIVFRPFVGAWGLGVGLMLGAVVGYLAAWLVLHRSART